MYAIKFTIQDKMSEIKSLFNIVGPISLAVTIPWIIFKMFCTVWLKRGYNSLVGKVGNLRN